MNFKKNVAKDNLIQVELQLYVSVIKIQSVYNVLSNINIKYLSEHYLSQNVLTTFTN